MFKQLSLMRLLAYGRIGSFVLITCLATLFQAPPAYSEKLWLNLYQMGPDDLGDTPQPSPVVLGCRFPGCFPGFSQQLLRLETSVKGPFLKQWVLGLEALPIMERSRITLVGDAGRSSPTAIQLGHVATVGGLMPEHGDRLPLMPVTVELDLVALRRWALGEGPPLAEAPQLVLEARQLVGDIEVHRWQFVYDFSALVPPAPAPQPLPGGDRVELKNYSRSSSPVILLARGSNLADRMTDVTIGKLSIDVENMTTQTPNVEVAVWAHDQQPVLLLRPRLKAEPETIPVIAPGLLKVTPKLFLPDGFLVPGVKWEDLAHCDYAVANQLFLRNRLGIELEFTTPTNSDAVYCEDETGLRGRTGFTAGNLNIFYVEQDYQPQNCCLQKVPEAMFLTMRATPTSLAHELGHAFGLWHDERSGNIMLGDALDRSDFALPQVYLMTFSEESIVNMFGFRTSPVRSKNECPIHCKPQGFAEFWSQCVKNNAAFSVTVSPSPTDKVHALLTSLNSEESVSGDEPLWKGLLAADQDLVAFLKGVARRGVRPDAVNGTIRAIRASLNGQECPVPADVYVNLYGSRVVENSKRAAANALFILKTDKSKIALVEVKQFVSESLRAHIDNLLLNW